MRIGYDRLEPAWGRRAFDLIVLLTVYLFAAGFLNFIVYRRPRYIASRRQNVSRREALWLALYWSKTLQAERHRKSPSTFTSDVHETQYVDEQILMNGTIHSTVERVPYTQSPEKNHESFATIENGTFDTDLAYVQSAVLDDQTENVIPACLIMEDFEEEEEEEQCINGEVIDCHEQNGFLRGDHESHALPLPSEEKCEEDNHLVEL